MFGYGCCPTWEQRIDSQTGDYDTGCEIGGQKYMIIHFLNASKYSMWHNFNRLQLHDLQF